MERNCWCGIKFSRIRYHDDIVKALEKNNISFCSNGYNTFFVNPSDADTVKKIIKEEGGGLVSQVYDIDSYINPPYTKILCKVLNCTIDDIHFLDKMNPEYYEMAIINLRYDEKEINIESLINAILEYGISQFEEKLKQKAEEETNPYRKELWQNFNPKEEITWKITYSQVDFKVKNKDDYVDFLLDELMEFEDNTGISLNI